MTKGMVLLYADEQRFDSTTNTLSVDMRLINRGDKPIRTPIELRVTDLSSSLGTVTVANSTNGNGGARAVWDVSHFVTGDRIPARVSSNTFRLSFHIQVSSARKLLDEEDLLSLGVRVF